MSRHQIQKVLIDHPFLRTVLRPALAVRRYWLAKQRSYKETVHRRLQKILVEDPVIHIDQFEGSFGLDVRSDLFARQILDENYESELIPFCRRFLAPGRDVIDVGANVGFYSVFFARLIQDSQKVLSVEPTTSALKRLYRNLQRNDVEDRVIVYEGVASNCEETIQINVIEGKEEYSTVGKVKHPSVTGLTYTTQEVKSAMLDTLVAKYSLDPGFIKIDVEGAEKGVIEGCRKTLETHRPVILSELSDSLLKANGTSAQEVITLIQQYDYLVIDPCFPTTVPGYREYGDILCVPKEAGFVA
jgi:FkbM family methyltransferase